jgi:hypothetical protein
MIDTDLLKRQESLHVFEKPGYFYNSSHESYRMLLSALDLGWYVEEPVYLRSRWNQEGEKVFLFILKHHSRSEPALITTRRTPEIERLVMKEGWQVD